MVAFHALNARDNGLIHYLFSEVARGDAEAFQQVMQEANEELQGLLSSRSVKYEELKSSLIPTSSGGLQILFLYDWSEDNTWNYAVTFAHSFLPHLRKDLRTSVLHGDLLDLGAYLKPRELQAVLVQSRPEEVGWGTLYGVYFTNLHTGDVSRLHSALTSLPGYRGYFDLSLGSLVRDYASQTLVAHWLIAQDKVILTHGPDSPSISDEDPVGYDLPMFGYEVVSVVDAYFMAFLSYKIEAQGVYQAADDRILNLAAITGEMVDPGSVSIVVHPDKLDKYLLRNEDKLRLMTRLGLKDVRPKDLEIIIRDKLMRSYVYDFRYAPDGCALFAVTAEFEKPDGSLTRRLLALKYEPASRKLALVTMY